jgi:hypothetical protein
VADSEQLAQLESRVVEAQRLIEIGREQEMFRRSGFHDLKLAGAMRQNGEGDHMQTLKFSSAPVNWECFAPSLRAGGAIESLLPLIRTKGQ